MNQPKENQQIYIYIGRLVVLTIDEYVEMRCCAFSSSLIRCAICCLSLMKRMYAVNKHPSTAGVCVYMYDRNALHKTQRFDGLDIKRLRVARSVFVRWIWDKLCIQLITKGACYWMRCVSIEREKKKKNISTNRVYVCVEKRQSGWSDSCMCMCVFVWSFFFSFLCIYLIHSFLSLTTNISSLLSHLNLK